MQDNDTVGDAGPGAGDFNEAHSPGGEQRQNMLRDQLTGRRPLVPRLSDHYQQIRQIIEQLRWPETRVEQGTGDARRAVDTETEGPAHRHRLVIEKRARENNPSASSTIATVPFGR
ncbi:hypothetical protein [Nocardia gipuzkoensis]